MVFYEPGLPPLPGLENEVFPWEQPQPQPQPESDSVCAPRKRGPYKPRAKKVAPQPPHTSNEAARDAILGYIGQIKGHMQNLEELCKFFDSVAAMPMPPAYVNGREQHEGVAPRIINIYTSTKDYLRLLYQEYQKALLVAYNSLNSL